MISKRRIRVGTQIISVPPHVREAIWIPNDISLMVRHPDTEFGFVSSWRTEVDGTISGVFCRFWSKYGWNVMRTTCNSELCNVRDLEQYDSHNQADIDKVIAAFRANPGEYGWNEQPPLDEHDEAVEELKDLLIFHDWWYQMSDDNRYYVAGHEKQNKIEALVKQLGDEGVEIYNKLCPYPELRKKMENNGPQIS